MRKIATRLSLLASLVALFVPGAARAQEGKDAPAPSYIYVEHFEMAPGDQPAFESAVADLVQAAGEAGLGADYAWSFWAAPSGYDLVFPFKNMAYWDDPMQWERQFKGTPGEAGLKAFQERVRSIQTVTTGEILLNMPAWSYIPEAGMGEVGGAELWEEWPKAGSEKEYGDIAKEWAAFFKKVGSPYALFGHRAIIGNTRAVYAVIYDNKSDYYGANSLEKLAAAKGLGDELKDLEGRWMSLLANVSHHDVTARDAMGYTPE